MARAADIVLHPNYGNGGSFTYTGTAGNSTDLPQGCQDVWLWATTNCYVRIGNTATATTSDICLPANVPVRLPVLQPTLTTNRVSAIQVSSGGTVYFCPFA